MTKSIFKYITKNSLHEPKSVDRLLVSAFIYYNKIEIKKNNFLKQYLIDESNTTEFHRLENFLTEIKRDGINLTFEALIEFFEFVISPKDRVVNGAVYTPGVIRDYIVEKNLTIKKKSIQNIKISDISCGCGGFLFTAAKFLKISSGLSYRQIYKDHLFGLDIQQYSITRSKLLLTTLAVSEHEDIPEFEFNLFTGNALEFEWTSHIINFKGFDIVVGNPPYVCSRNIDEESKKLLKNWSVCRTGHPDLYIPFFQIGMKILSESGVLGFITMNSFFKSVNGRALREYLQKEKYAMKIIDFGTNQIFRSRSTYTCICLIEKVEREYLEFIRSNVPEINHITDKQFFKIAYSTLDWLKGWNLQNNTLISKIESIGTPFWKKYKTRNGIATLKNSIYIFSPVKEDDKYYYLQNGSIYPIEKDVCKNIVNPNMLTEAESLRGLKEKIIFPYSFKQDDVLIIEEPEFKRKFPKTYSYLESKKSDLAKRDKGKAKKYKVWYSFGRNQSLEKLKHKLFFPHITPKTPNFIINNDEDLLFYNGISVIGKTLEELVILKKIMQSKLFWFYIKNSSKPYGSDYYSLSKNYIKNFGICDLTKEDKKYILQESDKEKLDVFFATKYGVKID